MLLIGYGGTGKSFTIKAIVQEIIKLNNGDGTVLIMAPTGKAALNAGKFKHNNKILLFQKTNNFFILIIWKLGSLP